MVQRLNLAAVAAAAILIGLPAAGFAQSNRDFPKPLTIPGKPIESRPPERAGDVPSYPQQTRAPYVKTAPYETTVISDKLKNPWSLAFLPDGKYLVTEREPNAAIRIVNKDGSLSAPLTGLETLATQGTLGLLEIALDPKFAQTHQVFFTFFERLTDRYSNTFVGRANFDEAAGALKDVKVIFRAEPFAPVKNFSTKQGGRIVFTPEGYLIVDFGDRDNGIPWTVAQELDNHLGKVVRITQEGAPAPGNPFIGKVGAKPEIWAYGFRSPEGLAFDKDGQLWQSDHGPRGGDEFNNVQKGVNYGWPLVTRGINYSGEPIGTVTKEGTKEPVYYWDPVIAPSGLAFYDGNLFPQWKGSALAGGLRGKLISRLKMKGGKVVEEEALLVEQDARIRDIRIGPDQAVYVLAEPNKLLKLTPKK